MLTSVAALALLVPFAPQGEIAEIDLHANDLIHDPATGRLWASVSSEEGVQGNSLTWVDPVNLTLGPFIPVGSEPSALALSDDGTALYVGLDGAGRIQRVELPGVTLRESFPLGEDPLHGALYPEDIEVQPGQPDVIAVSRRRLGVSPRHGGVAIFEGGVPRPEVTISGTGSNVIEWADVPGTLYGFNNETTEFGLRTMGVDGGGVTTLQVADTALGGFDVDMHHHQGVLYGTNSFAVDATTGTTLGFYPGLPRWDDVLADAGRDRVYFVMRDRLDVFRLSDFEFLDSRIFTGAVGESGGLVLWGEDGVAFRNDSGHVYLWSEAPVRRLSLSPSGGTFLSSQNFDVGLVITAPGTSFTRVLEATLDGNDMTEFVRARALPGRVNQGTRELETLRLPDFGEAVGLRLEAGAHLFAVTLELADGTTVANATEWTFLETTEDTRRRSERPPLAE